ncbi:hypothetical protein LAJ19_02300 [Deinococcus taeanensis]|uniref:hypothetical protein n=1 Tax=Deinococcus taeanensis TaxID=2737050 RepID=UPI001CDBE5EF|nr:hypothetical protein [Deinococcus taeanensis]UBV43077.1 hypothetical protein LAJ19_02300 [Deinococcus taeanensis]
MLEGVARDLRAGDAGSLTRAARRSFTLTFLVLAAPGVPLGGLLALVRPLTLRSPGWLAGVVLLAGLLAAAALYLARRTARDAGLPEPQRTLAAAMQAATAPAVPFLIGCAFLRSPGVVALLWVVAGALFFLARPRGGPPAL